MHFLLLMGSPVVTVLLGELVQLGSISRFLFGIHRKMNTNASVATSPSPQAPEANPRN